MSENFNIIKKRIKLEQDIVQDCDPNTKDPFNFLFKEIQILKKQMKAFAILFPDIRKIEKKLNRIEKLLDLKEI